METIAVVGASLAGAHAIQAIRRHDFAGELLVIGAEAHRPYDRPPLSKGYLSGSVDSARLRLRSFVDPEALDIQWRLGQQATGLELAASGGGALTLDDGSVIAAEGIVIATGARARPLPGAPELHGLGVLRTVEDADRLGLALRAAPGHLVVVGFGFIGAEVAATAREAGWKVTILEAAEYPMSRVLGRAEGMAIAELHRQHGVEVRLGTGVDQVIGSAGRVSAVTTSEGDTIPCEQVVVGIGVVPETDWLAGSGLSVDNGLVVDETLLAAPGIVAAGDVARWPNRRYGGRSMRVEQWENAVEMGAYAGERLLAWAAGREAAPFEPVPWFWSDQYDRKIQLAGLPTARSELLQGSFEEQRFVLAYLADDSATEAGAPAPLLGALCWNRPRQAIMARQLIAAAGDIEAAREQLG